MTASDLTNALDSWLRLNSILSSLPEEACWALLDREKKGRKRSNFLVRIHARASRLRARRELRELMKETGNV